MSGPQADRAAEKPGFSEETRLLEGRTFTLFGVTFDLRLTLLVIFSTLVPMLDFYGHSPTGVKA